MKWTATDAGKIQVNRFNDAWAKLRWEHNSFVELRGTVGADEYRSTLHEVFGHTVREDVNAAMERVGERYGWTLTAKNAAEVTRAIIEEIPALQASRPVRDKRETAKQVAERNEATQTARREQEEKARATQELFSVLYGAGDDVTIQPGEMAVTAQLCYDNSDMMTDYFDRHASFGPAFALLVVRRQAETQALARSGQQVSPILTATEMEWRTEKYSMGHGNYLESEAFELPSELAGLRQRYGGGTVTHGHWEIKFITAGRTPQTLPAFKGFGACGSPEPFPATDSNPVTSITVSENTARGGVEIRFPENPGSETIGRLKAHGWRWSRFGKCWYKRASEEARRFAAQFETAGEPQALTQPEPSPAEAQRGA